ncbi:hypothetical protein FRC04_010591 [Tulasnella sp. 424]|nr:hypothetical protein FRC04_010591 [Tulasnella sp. 424]KAG8972327.1 hypothetical protein FRC05_010169 [Tulasnella sp. 425]
MQDLKQSAQQCAAEFWEAFRRLDDDLLNAGSRSGFEEVDALMKRFDSFKATFDNLVRQTEVKHIRQRNALLPIHKLPDELLHLIFHLLLFTTTGLRRSRYVQRISTLRAVSWWWRDLIGRSPLFWAHISSKDHADFVSEALERSLNLPLHLRYIGSHAYRRELAFWDKAFAHHHRWESVAIHEPEGGVIQKYFYLPTPSLKNLLLSTVTGNVRVEAGLDKLFGGALANLEVLRAVQWQNIDWSYGHFTRLRVLEIEDHYALTMGTIFDILSGNPCLEVFRLHYAIIAPYTPPHPLPSPIDLESLKELKWMEVQQEMDPWTGLEGRDVALARILQRIRVPACSKFEVSSWLQDGSGVSPEELVRLILPPMQVIKTARTASEQSTPHPVVVEALFGESEFQLKVSKDSCSSPSFSIRLEALPRSIAKRWMTEQLGEESGRTLDLRLSFEYPGGESSLEDIIYFQQWESVTKLAIDGSSGSQRTIAHELFQLSTPCVSPNGAKMMPFPALQTLRLSYLSFKGKDLIASMTTRFSSNAPITSEAGISAPAALTIVLADGTGVYTEAYIDEIEAIPGIKVVKFLEESPPMHDASSVHSASDWPPPRQPFQLDDDDESGDPSGLEGDPDSENPI